MSYSFSVDINAPVHIDAVTRLAGIEDLQFLKAHVESDSDVWPKGVSHVFQDGLSVRAVEIEYSGHNIQVRILPASSPDDYDLALSLVTGLLKHQGGTVTPPENGAMSLDQFLAAYDTTWAIEHSRNTLSAVLGTAQSDTSASTQITGVHADMRLGKRLLGQLINEKSRIDLAFYYRMRTLNFIHDQDIHRAQTAILASKDGQRHVRLASFAEKVATLICDKNTLVSLMSIEDFDIPPAERTLPRVPVNTLQRLVGEQAQWLSEELLLVPAISGLAWKKLLANAWEHHIEDLSGYSYSPLNDPYDINNTNLRGALTDDELNTLAQAVIAVFCFIAAADGNIDKKEINVFKHKVLSGISSDHALMQKILLATVEIGDELVSQFLQKDIDVSETLHAAASILDGKLTPGDALDIKRSLHGIGLSVAQASGGFLGRFGSKVSKEEEQTLKALATLLNID